MDSGKPTQLVHEGFFDMTIDDCDEEVSGGVSCVRRANRRRLVLVPTQGGHGLPSGRSCGWKPHRKWCDLRSVGCDLNDTQSQDEDHPHSDESDVERESVPTKMQKRTKFHTSPNPILLGRSAITAGFESHDTVDLGIILAQVAILFKLGVTQ